MSEVRYFRWVGKAALPMIVSSWCLWVSTTLNQVEIQVSELRGIVSPRGKTSRESSRLLNTLGEGESEMNKGKLVALMNRYPEGKVSSSGDHVQVHAADGTLLASMAKNGNGDWVDHQDETGARDAVDFAPIPKEARAFKLYKDGRIGPSEEYDARRAFAVKLAKDNDGCVPSEAELAAAQKAPASPAPASAGKPKGSESRPN